MARTAGESELFLTRRNHLGDLEWIPFQREPKCPLLAERYSQLRANAQCLQPQSCSLATRRKQEYLLALREELEDEEDDPYSYLYRLPTPGSTHQDTSCTASGSGIGALHRHSFNCDSISFPDNLDYSFQHGLLNTSLVPSLDSTTASITLPPSQTPRPSPTSTATVPTTDTSRVPDKDELPHSSTDIPHKDYNTTALYDENTQTRKPSSSKIVQKSSIVSQFDNSHDSSNLKTELPVPQPRGRNRDFGEEQLSALQTVPVKKVRFLLGEGVPDSSSRLSTDTDSSQQQISALQSLDFPLLFLPRTKPQKTLKRQKKRRIY